jgi:hypothetical protein
VLSFSTRPKTDTIILKSTSFEKRIQRDLIGLISHLLMSGDPLGYFDNELLNKYIKKVYKCVLLSLDWWSFKCHAILLSFDSPLKTDKLKPL